jgi:hypothetical protein
MAAVVGVHAGKKSTRRERDQRIGKRERGRRAFLSSPQGCVGGENPLAGIDSRCSDTEVFLWLEDDDDLRMWAGLWWLRLEGKRWRDGPETAQYGLEPPFFYGTFSNFVFSKPFANLVAILEIV